MVINKLNKNDSMDTDTGQTCKKCCILEVYYFKVRKTFITAYLVMLFLYLRKKGSGR